MAELGLRIVDDVARNMRLHDDQEIADILNLPIDVFANAGMLSQAINGLAADPRLADRRAHSSLGWTIGVLDMEMLRRHGVDAQTMLMLLDLGMDPVFEAFGLLGRFARTIRAEDGIGHPPGPLPGGHLHCQIPTGPKSISTMARFPCSVRTDAVKGMSVPINRDLTEFDPGGIMMAGEMVFSNEILFGGGKALLSVSRSIDTRPILETIPMPAPGSRTTVHYPPNHPSIPRTELKTYTPRGHRDGPSEFDMPKLDAETRVERMRLHSTGGPLIATLGTYDQGRTSMPCMDHSEVDGFRILLDPIAPALPTGSEMEIGYTIEGPPPPDANINFRLILDHDSDGLLPGAAGRNMFIRGDSTAVEGRGCVRWSGTTFNRGCVMGLDETTRVGRYRIHATIGEAMRFGMHINRASGRRGSPPAPKVIAEAWSNPFVLTGDVADRAVVQKLQMLFHDYVHHIGIPGASTRIDHIDDYPFRNGPMVDDDMAPPPEIRVNGDIVTVHAKVLPPYSSDLVMTFPLAEFLGRDRLSADAARGTMGGAITMAKDVSTRDAALHLMTSAVSDLCKPATGKIDVRSITYRPDLAAWLMDVFLEIREEGGVKLPNARMVVSVDATGDVRFLVIQNEEAWKHIKLKTWMPPEPIEHPSLPANHS